jgi:quinol monooxygenase YgiN
VVEEDDIVVRERISSVRSVVLLVDVSGSMRGERVRTAAATVGALAAELSRDNLAVIAFGADAAVLCHLGQRIPAQALVESMLRIPARGLTNVAFPLQAAARELARIPARDARVLLLSDCVHNAGPDPRPFAARLPRLDVLLDATGEQDRWLGGELARLGRGKFRVAAGYRDVAPALSSFFTELKESAMAVVIVATLFPVPEHRDEVIAAIEKVQEKVHASDDDCLLYALHEGRDGRLVFVEKYTSMDAVGAHSQSPELAELVAALDGKLAQPMDVQLLTPHPAGSADKGVL